MNLQKLLLIHGIITLAAGIVLIIAPAAIPKTINIQLSGNEYLLSHFLGAAELGMAYLSFFSRTIQDRHALRIIATAFIVFHAATGIIELYGLLHGISSEIIGNILLRIVVIVLFYYYGIYKIKQQYVKASDK